MKRSVRTSDKPIVRLYHNLFMGKHSKKLCISIQYDIKILTTNLGYSQVEAAAGARHRA